jgi:hypothetical protein
MDFELKYACKPPLVIMERYLIVDSLSLNG